jgi:thiamine pyrophosphate-dependent acetolactate synthase large subunit-like protein
MIDEAADFLLRRGLRHFFGVLGGGVTLELASRLKSGGATYIPSHFEGSAAIMAGTWGRIKNSPYTRAGSCEL